MNIKKNNNLCPQAKEQIKQINELGEGGGGIKGKLQIVHYTSEMVMAVVGFKSCF